MIVVFTKTVAHKMQTVAAKQAEKTKTVIKYVHSSSANALNQVLTQHFQTA